MHLTTEKYLVLVSPGTIFSPTDEVRDDKGWSYVRMCFAAVDESDVEKTSKRFVAGVQDFWKKKSLDDIEEVEAAAGAVEGDMPEGLLDLRGWWGC